MPRNGSGSASLAEPAFVPNTPISSSSVNNDLSDIADMLTGSLARDGQGGMTAVLPLANTGFSYLTDPNTGMRRTAADTQAISVGGVDAATFTATAVDVVALKVAGVTAYPVPTAGLTDASVTYAKIQNVTNNRLLGNVSGGAAAPAEIPLGTGLSFSGGSLVAAAVAGPMAGAQGLVITNNTGTPNSQIDLFADQVTLINPTGNVPIYTTLLSSGVTINTSITGVNGLDTGARASSTWYNLFFISDGSSMAALASLSATAPTMPGVYVYKVRVGAMRTDGSGNFLRSRQVGNKTTNLTSAANLPTLGATNVGATYTAIAVANFVPPTAVSMFVGTFLQSNGVGPSYLGVAGYQAGTAPSTQPYPEFLFEVNGASVLMNSGTPEIFLQSTNIFYSSSANTTVFLGAAGWRDKVNAS